MARMTAIPFQQEIYYPESDGEPMGETQLHMAETMYLVTALEDHFDSEPDVYVWGDMFLYYVEGDPRSVISPDVFVIKGVPKKVRRIYKAWEEGGRLPCFIIEVTSDSTRTEDLIRKRALYERLGVEEYILYDPLGEYLDPRLLGLRLVHGKHQPISLEPDGSMVSRTTGVTLRLEGDRIRLVKTATGEPLLRRVELRDEVARLRAEIERLRKT
jgi:Uma2 family endonuclease